MLCFVLAFIINSFNKLPIKIVEKNPSRFVPLMPLIVYRIRFAGITAKYFNAHSNARHWTMGKCTNTIRTQAQSGKKVNIYWTAKLLVHFVNVLSNCSNASILLHMLSSIKRVEESDQTHCTPNRIRNVAIKMKSRNGDRRAQIEKAFMSKYNVTCSA